MTTKRPVYLDFNATTPVDKRVLATMLPYFSEDFGNAASTTHAFGQQASAAVSHARQQIASLINVSANEIIFTSGATESNNIALLGVAERYAHKGDHIITCVTEHKAVLDSAKRLEKLGKRVTYLPVDSFGRVDLDQLRQAITPQTILISIMAANNEIGTVAPLREIGLLAREHDIIFHTDAAQYAGHMPLDVQALNIDLLSISAHKLYGPKGIGALYVRRENPRVDVAPVIYGGGHEQGIRSGTLNVPAIVGFGVAAELCQAELEDEAERLRGYCQKIFRELSRNIEGVELNGHPTERLPHNLNISITGTRSSDFIALLGDVAISAGSACNTANPNPSHVLCALGFGSERALSSLRISVGRTTTLEEVEYAIGRIIEASQVLQLVPA
ncbi:MAG: cysteine desulfurase [Chloroflexi bacterium]|nr:cysteine desulfurase [Chloroflexota bacterium]OJW04396.1 MAG: IscS subfamily cysteine desulfurase [Chloroflexi bacterium 54-19]